jgi:hypothetical protein
VIALLMNPNQPNPELQIRAVQEAARVKGVQLPVLMAGTEGECGPTPVLFDLRLN